MTGVPVTEGQCEKIANGIFNRIADYPKDSYKLTDKEMEYIYRTIKISV